MSTSSNTAVSKEDSSAKLAVTVFPFIILVAFALGFWLPETIKPYSGQVTIALGIIMFGMGLTLTLPDFGYVAKRPLPVLIGVIAQFVIMPGLAILLVKIFRLSPELAVGVVLVGSAPGGTSSNVISYLAKGDVALSVTMTTISTLLAPIFTPLLTLWLAGQYLPVSASAMSISIVKMVLVPVVLGLAVRMLLRKNVDKILPALPWISVLGIAYVVAAVVSKSADSLAHAGLLVFAIVVVHNALGYVLGYFSAKFLKLDESAARTTSVEVGMQNSGLAATLATTYFSPLSALPAAVFSVWHNISGGLLALLYRRIDARRQAHSESIG
ncbi:bile acid:sodium symporter family protein [Corynebacterium ulceribovis]|uniref:bile acid:sodium symporter family protein n=1 Tax=Corynebacterium ulceribovis TaxID=487732 RepID=UPI0004782307|nr:bile acid:sodium symporter family protein [Corynebacterium ulceribovis]